MSSDDWETPRVPEHAQIKGSMYRDKPDHYWFIETPADR